MEQVTLSRRWNAGCAMATEENSLTLLIVKLSFNNFIMMQIVKGFKELPEKLQFPGNATVYLAVYAFKRLRLVKFPFAWLLK